MKNKYGECECGGILKPVWFIEEEVKMRDGSMIETGRKRTACSHLTCSRCFKNKAVDDSFDGVYR